MGSFHIDSRNSKKSQISSLNLHAYPTWCQSTSPAHFLIPQIQPLKTHNPSSNALCIFMAWCLYVAILAHWGFLQEFWTHIERSAYVDLRYQHNK